MAKESLSVLPYHRVVTGCVLVVILAILRNRVEVVVVVVLVILWVPLLELGLITSPMFW